MTCTTAGCIRVTCSPYPAGIDNASQALPLSRNGSISRVVVTVRTTEKLGDASNRLISSRLAADRSPSATTTGTSRTSVVAAYPSIVSCTMGATTTRPNRRGFWRSSWNSLRTRHLRRCMSAPIFREAEGGEAQHRRRVQRERGKLREKVVHGGPLQHDSSEGDQEIPRWNQIRHELQSSRHAAD